MCGGSGAGGAGEAQEAAPVLQAQHRPLRGAAPLAHLAERCSGTGRFLAAAGGPPAAGAPLTHAKERGAVSLKGVVLPDEQWPSSPSYIGCSKGPAETRAHGLRCFGVEMAVRGGREGGRRGWEGARRGGGARPRADDGAHRHTEARAAQQAGTGWRGGRLSHGGGWLALQGRDCWRPAATRKLDGGLNALCGSGQAGSVSFRCSPWRAQS